MVLYFVTSMASGYTHIIDMLTWNWQKPILVTGISDIDQVHVDGTSVFFVMPDLYNLDLLTRIRDRLSFSIILAVGIKPENSQLLSIDEFSLNSSGLGIDLFLSERDFQESNIPLLRKLVSSISEKSRLKDQIQVMQGNLNEWENIFQESLDIMFIIDANTKQIVQANHTASLILGYTSDQMIGRDFTYFTRTKTDTELEKTTFHGSSISNQGLVTVDHKWIPMESTWRLFQKDGITHIIATFRDISERRSAEEKIQYLAYYNTITGMPNKIYFEQKLRQKIIDSKHNKQGFAVAVLDIDNFKLINETLGPSTGDRVLSSVAERLKLFQFVESFSAHFGGDDFGMILHNMENIDDLEVAIHHIQSELRKEILLEGRELYLTFSFGLSIYPDHGHDTISLMKTADLAMYSAKERGKNNYSVYSEMMTREVHIRMEVENDLRKAILNQEFLLYYQPQISMQSGRIVGMEALVRWNHPGKGLIPPSEFIHVAELTGLIHEIGIGVLKKACETAKKWLDMKLLDFPVSVNVSAKQWNNLSLSKDILTILKESQLPSHFLTLELTESSIMENPERSLIAFQDLSNHGIFLSVDDFGTGYSSLSYLKKLKVHHLKIDKSFVQDLVENENDRAISLAIINLAHSLDLNVVAEGVESPDQLEILKDQNCDSYQGFLFSPPLPEKEFEALLKNYRKKEYGLTIS